MVKLLKDVVSQVSLIGESLLLSYQLKCLIKVQRVSFFFAKVYDNSFILEVINLSAELHDPFLALAWKHKLSSDLEGFITFFISLALLGKY